MPNHHYNKNLKEFAKRLRNNSTKAEIILWSKALKARKTGYQCQRQRPIDKYIPDFYFPEVKLILEVDGYSHTMDEKIRSDKIRDNELAELGYKTIRIPNPMVFEDLNNAIKQIEYELERRRVELNISKPERKKRRTN